MPVITYTATENIIATHTLGLSYQIENALQIIDEDTRPIGTELTSIGSITEYELDRAEELVSIGSDIVVELDKPLWKEFLTSVHARETFQIDFTGTIAAPGVNQDCIIKSGGYKPIRERPGVQLYKFFFAVRLL